MKGLLSKIVYCISVLKNLFNKNYKIQVDIMQNWMFVFSTIALMLAACSTPSSSEHSAINTIDTLANSDNGATSEIATGTSLQQQLPEGYTVFERLGGDLNADNITDSVLIIKKINPDNIVDDEVQGVVDRNRRGVLVFLNNNNTWGLVCQNRACFSSENEDGGVYFAPELSVEIDKGNLYFHYGHGRYGNWTYTFRYKNNDFEWIGFDNTESNGPVVTQITSINFLTKKKQVKVNTNADTEEPDKEIYKESWSDIQLDKRTLLSEVEDFDGLGF